MIEALLGSGCSGCLGPALLSLGPPSSRCTSSKLFKDSCIAKQSAQC